MPRATIGHIPAAWVEPSNINRRKLVIWLTGFSGDKDAVKPQLDQLAAHGYTALSFDPYEHGERTKESRADLSTRVRGNIRRFFWPILAYTAEEVPMVIDWAIKNLGVDTEVGIGGTSMGGDISVAAASVDWRIRAVAAIVGTPDWMRPGSFEFPGTPDHIAQDCYDRRNPLTHLDLYKGLPAITFESGDIDHQVPAANGEQFIKELRPIYASCPERLRMTRHPNVGHGFVQPMMDNCIQWFERFLP